MSKQSPKTMNKAVSAGLMDGKTWLRYSISIWDDLVKSPEERKFKHPAMFPSQLTDRLIEIFSLREGGLVLDPFMGSGSTLCSAYRRGLPSVGFELSEEFIAMTRERLAAIRGDPDNYPRIIQDDSRRLQKYVSPGTVGLCITSPPYWDILNQRRTADGKPIRNYGMNLRDLSSISDYHEFLGALQQVFAQIYEVLITGAYCIVVVMDIRKKAVFYPFHMDITLKLRDVGFTLDDIIIWDRRREYNNLRPLGYPYVFRVNKVHEYILIFQKK
ncbi:DNA methyltransferase [Calderihabitans maritimus]|uniref:Methyltransferase n=1 Tax=Calderihabitans maritimus TaxID=1246530 RepID=A0A1Z5HNX4_9FIRM|nr:DNA methyltransferase [Calderihabitans maritimus]GAW91239.1 putative RNA methylase [Calderihabitans maritimus]